ncbi:adenylate kinase [Candidatus Fermentibacteria bacterium]|nr:adenylate kinase [Candidatus Fermentibacteria bacterium]
MILVLVGPPGSGKGTQAALLAARCGMIHLSTGELLREARLRGTPVGREAAAYLDEGRLVPDDTVAALVAQRLRPGPATYLLDGFPRNVEQAAHLERMAAETRHAIEAVVLLDVPEAELVRRLTGRARADDDPAIIQKRLAVYVRETAPLIDHYDAKGLLRRIHGRGAVKTVHGRILRALGLGRA